MEQAWLRVALTLFALLAWNRTSSAQGTCPGGTVCGGCPPLTQTFTCELPFEVPAAGLRTCNLPSFDTSLGTLIGVSITGTVKFRDRRFQFENLDPNNGCQGSSSPNAWTLTAFGAIFEPSQPSPGTPFCTNQVQCNDVIPPLPPFDGVIDFGLPSGSRCQTNFCQAGSGFTQNCAPVPDVACPTVCISDATALNAYKSNLVGPTVTFQMDDVASQTQQSGCGKIITAFRVRVGYTVQVTYIYCNNFPPVANPDTVRTCQGVPVAIGVLNNDTDPNGNINCAGVVIVTPPTSGTATINSACGGVANGGCPNNCVLYTPNAGFNGNDSFTYRVVDALGCSSQPATVTVTTHPPPNAANDTATTCHDTPIVIGILNNDVPAAGSTLTCNSVAITSQPANGTLTLNIACGGTPNNGCPNNCVRYTPNAGFAGNDQFTYSVTDSRGCVDTAVVNIVVRAGPNAGNDTATTCQGNPVSIGILNNDVPEPGRTLACGGVTITQQPASGTLTLNLACGGTPNGGCPNSCVRYTPNAGFSGNDTFKYRVNDSNGCASNEATVAITVNPPPNAVNDSAATCREQPVVIGHLQNDVPAAGSTLVCGSTQITSAPTNGTVTLNVACGGTANGGCANNCLRYTPNAAFTGQDQFTYSITDSRGCIDTAIVTVNVRTGAVAGNDLATTCQGNPVQIGILNNDVPEPGRTLACGSVTITQQPASGTLTLNLACGGTPNGGCANSCVRYTPNAGFNGNDTFKYRVNDSNGCASNEATVAITVNPPPNAVNDNATTCHDTPVIIGILSNDVPAAGSTLVCGSVAITSAPANGTVTLNVACGGTANGGCANNCVRYTPNPGFAGNDQFTYSVTDSRGCIDTAAVNIVVRAGPNAGNDTATTCQGNPVLIGILNNDVPEPGRTLACGSVTITQQPASGTLTLNLACGGTPNGGCANSCVRYTPNAGFNGNDTFKYRVNDSNTCASNEATVTITVNPPPNAVDDAATTCRELPVVVGHLANDVPAAGSTLVCGSTQITSAPANGTVTLNVACGGTANGGCANNCLRYTPNAGFAGDDQFTYSITDSRGCVDTAIVRITVRTGPNAGNDVATTCQGLPVLIGILNNDVPEPGRTLACGSVTVTQQPASGTLTLNQACGGTPNGGCANSCVRYTPNAGFNGNDTFKYRVNDNNGCSSNEATVAITVKPPPNAVDDPALLTCRNTPLSIDVLANDVPAPGRFLVCNTLSIVSGPTNNAGTAVPTACTGTTAGCTATCRVLFTPNAGFLGTTSFTYEITDNNGCKDQAVVTVRVCAPTANNDTGEVCQGGCTDINVLGNDSTAQGCGVGACSTIVIVDPPDHGTAELTAQCTGNAPGCVNAGCRVRYCSTDPAFAGIDSFTYTVKDANGCVSNTATVNVNVKPGPTLTDCTFTKDPASDAPIQIAPLTCGDPDANPGAGCTFDCNSIVITAQPTQGTVTIGPNCTFTYTPSATFDDDDFFCYRIFNSCGCFDEACIRIEEPEPTCIERNRRICGSLLLYPEYSNRPGELTLYTITDACCDFGQSTWVEFIFIRENTCLEENRTFFLTPCDTLTFVTSAAIPNTERGYAYAYAKVSQNVGSKPKVFNHLVGNLLFLSGWETLNYGLNAVSFRGIGPEGSLNDEDDDGVLDLDGVTEYEEAPDQLLIPRFLGQDAGSTGMKSRLILLAMSGGTAFNFNGGTEVLFSIYDDDENANSATYKFYCWKKPLLTDISGAFLQSFLASPIDDPDEPAGWQARETGWFRVDGRFAHSPQETIDDPAVYAVLIEHWTYGWAADLPFEYCSQINGDLLPNNLLGDPRVGFPAGQLGDDQ